MSGSHRVLGLIVALVALSLATPALAQDESANQQPATVDLRLTVPGNSDIPPQFIATVRDSEGNVIPGVAVDFSRQVEFLGTERMAFLGSGTTDVSGSARLVVLPRQEQARVVASVPGSEVAAAMDATFPEDRIDRFFDPEHEHGLLTPLRTVMPTVIATVVALLWVFIIGLVVWTTRRIRHLGEREEGQIA